MNAAEYLCRLLEQYGVEYIFGLFGDIQTDFAHAVRKSKIKWISVHNEKCGGFMADIYARCSGKVGVVFTTLGPGATNLTSALANATYDRSPIIAISDQVATSDLHLQTHQFVDFEKAFSPQTGITKYAATIRSILEIPTVFEHAFTIANTEPKGAVHISIPFDIMTTKISKSLNYVKQKENQHTFPKGTVAYAHLKHILSNVKNPGLVIVGGSVERSYAQIAFHHFVEYFQLPVLTTFRGKNVIPMDHPQCLGTISRHLKEALQLVLRKVSYVLLVGYDYNEGVLPSLWKEKADHVYNIECYNNRIPQVFNIPSWFGDLTTLFTKLITEKKPNYVGTFPFAKTKQLMHEALTAALAVRQEQFHPRRIITAINQTYAENSIVICDVGLNKYYSGLLLKATGKNQIFFSNGQSAMAFTSGAVGAKVACPKKNVIVLVGDGGFLMDPQEVLTAVKYKFPITWIIFNNGGLGLVEQAQLKKENITKGVRFAPTSFAKLAEAFGVGGITLKHSDNLTDILNYYKKVKRSVIIDIPVKYTLLRER